MLRILLYYTVGGRSLENITVRQVFEHRGSDENVHRTLYPHTDLQRIRKHARTVHRPAGLRIFLIAMVIQFYR